MPDEPMPVQSMERKTDYERRTILEAKIAQVMTQGNRTILYRSTTKSLSSVGRTSITSCICF